MAATPDMVLSIAPELADTFIPSRIVTFIGFAQLNVNRSVWGDKADLAEAVMAAHLMTLSSRGGQGGVVTQEKVGDISRSYAKPEGDDESLSTTSYGQWFLQMRRTLTITPIVTC